MRAESSVWLLHSRCNKLISFKRDFKRLYWNDFGANNHLTDACRAEPKSIIKCARDVCAVGERHLDVSHVKIIVRRASRWRIFIGLMYSRRRCVGYFVLWVPISHCMALSFAAFFRFLYVIVRRLSAQIEKKKKTHSQLPQQRLILPKVSPLWVANTVSPSTSSNRITV